MGCGASATVPSNMIGKSDFVVSYVIGRGGFGKVYSSLHTSSKTWVALKEQKIHRVLRHKNGLSLIHSELSTLKAAGRHNFVVGITYAFCDDRAFYMALDLCIGGDLRYHLRNLEIFTERRVSFIATCMASALNHIHNCGVLHRDIKPENIIYDEYGFPYLTDFGVAFNSGIVGHPSKIKCFMSSGTKQYLAPEVFTYTHEHGYSSDFWSLGVMMYEFLFRKRPFARHCPLSFIQHCTDLLHARQAERGGPVTCETKRVPVVAYMGDDKLTGQCEVLHSVEDGGTGCEGGTEPERNSPPSSPSVLPSYRQERGRGGGRKDSIGSDTDRRHTASNHETTLADADDPPSPQPTHVSEALPEGLRTVIPDSSSVLGIISPSCKRVLSRLLDARSDERYGYEELSMDSWFTEQGWDWRSIERKDVCPPFLPNLQMVSTDVCSKYLFDTSTEDAAAVASVQYASVCHPEGHLLDLTMQEFYYVHEDTHDTLEVTRKDVDRLSSPSKSILEATCSQSSAGVDDPE